MDGWLVRRGQVILKESQMATVVAPEKVAPKDFKPEVPPDWCPGCGDFGVLNALFQACAEIDLPPRDLLVVSGIGCSSNLPGFIRAYGVHSLHGRALPFATGAKLANHAMTVIATRLPFGLALHGTSRPPTRGDQ